MTVPINQSSMFNRRDIVNIQESDGSMGDVDFHDDRFMTADKSMKDLTKAGASTRRSLSKAFRKIS